MVRVLEVQSCYEFVEILYERVQIELFVTFFSVFADSVPHITLAQCRKNQYFLKIHEYRMQLKSPILLTKPQLPQLAVDNIAINNPNMFILRISNNGITDCGELPQKFLFPFFKRRALTPPQLYPIAVEIWDGELVTEGQ